MTNLAQKDIDINKADNLIKNVIMMAYDIILDLAADKMVIWIIKTEFCESLELDHNWNFNIL